MSDPVHAESEAFHTEDMTISMGPQHPSTHGVLRFIVKTDGEVMREAIPDVGYLHRSIEKIGERLRGMGMSLIPIVRITWRRCLPIRLSAWRRRSLRGWKLPGAGNSAA